MKGLGGNELVSSASARHLVARNNYRRMGGMRIGPACCEGMRENAENGEEAQPLGGCLWINP